METMHEWRGQALNRNKKSDNKKEDRINGPRCRKVGGSGGR